MDTVNHPQLLIESILAAVNADAFESAQTILVEHDQAVRAAATATDVSHESMARLLTVQRQLMTALTERRDLVSIKLRELSQSGKGARAYLAQDPT